MPTLREQIDGFNSLVILCDKMGPMANMQAAAFCEEIEKHHKVWLCSWLVSEDSSDFQTNFTKLFLPSLRILKKQWLYYGIEISKSIKCTIDTAYLLGFDMSVCPIVHRSAFYQVKELMALELTLNFIGLMELVQEIESDRLGVDHGVPGGDTHKMGIFNKGDKKEIKRR